MSTEEIEDFGLDSSVSKLKTRVPVSEKFETIGIRQSVNNRAKQDMERERYNITITTKCRTANALVFPVVPYGCESWTIRKAERRRIDSFELWCWRRLLRIPWTAGITITNQLLKK